MLKFTPEKNIQNRIVYDMPEEEYFAASGLNQSLIKTISPDYGFGCGCPALYKYKSAQESEPTPAMQRGSRFHSMVLGGDNAASYTVESAEELEPVFQKWVVAGIESGSKAAYTKMKSYAEYIASNGRGFTASAPYKEWSEGRDIISVADFAELSAMQESIYNNRDIMELLDAAENKEVSIFAAHKFEDGKLLQKKARLDVVTPNVIADLKTCASINPRQFSYDVVKYGYDIQAAWYIDAARSAGMEQTRFAWIAQETKPPYFSCVYWLPEDWLRLAKIKYTAMLHTLKKCIDGDAWPGPQSDMLEPPYTIKSELELLS